MRGLSYRHNGEKVEYMKLKCLMRYCAIKKNDNFRLIDTCNMTDLERIFLLTNIIDDRTEKHFFNFSDKLGACYRIQTDINYYKTGLRYTKTIEERQQYIYELDICQELLNDIILSLRK